MSETRLIRKYVNRRLYDTTESRYVNLDDLRRVINAGGEIKVVDQANGRDITTTVQLQIIGEIEKSGAPLLTPDFLASLIRLAGKERDPALGDRLHAALRAAVTDPRAARTGFESEAGTR
jgi:polyhydroxyalkanoate synthesis repressor PhaR